ncbi:MAG: bifunctional 4-hydroxy-2-oxoglutarate aldolase/2-dehydro-3-deoxy-phosphogluconate aldolase [Victivallales bacterium]|nr:bifunctional 4-hydroxy-2-oxoglutarate aldolase/2-dehydro-3-deoxy-phosphogluconate aldolase [Victivallales bacterium]
MLEKLRKHGVVPVIAVDTPEDGLRLCEALLKGGLPVAEITFRTAAAAETIKAASTHFPELILGAGTVLTTDQVKKAVDAGAKFAVAPGCNPRIIEAAQQAGLFFAPGICTPSDIERALELGCKLMKFFPAEASGGVKMLKALIGPYGHTGVQFCPTGGVTTQNLADYLALPQVAFAGGTWIAAKDAIKAKDWAKIEQAARDAVAIVKAIRA